MERLPLGSRIVVDSEFLHSVVDPSNPLRDHYAALLELLYLGTIHSIEIPPYTVLAFVSELIEPSSRRGIVLSLESFEGLRKVSSISERVGALIAAIRDRIVMQRYRLGRWLCERVPDHPLCSDAREALEALCPRISSAELATDLAKALRLVEKAREVSGREPSLWRALVAAYTHRIARSSTRPVFVVSSDSVYSDMGVPWIDVREIERVGYAKLASEQS